MPKSAAEQTVGLAVARFRVRPSCSPTTLHIRRHHACVASQIHPNTSVSMPILLLIPIAFLNRKALGILSTAGLLGSDHNACSLGRITEMQLLSCELYLTGYLMVHIQPLSKMV